MFLCVTGLLLYNYLLHEINDKSLSIKKLAEYLDEMRLGLLYNDKIVEKNKKNDTLKRWEKRQQKYSVYFSLERSFPLE